MKKQIPLLTTYISNQKEAEEAISKGVTSLILEDERGSLKMMEEPKESVYRLMSFLEKKYPLIQLSLVIDRPVHMNNEDELLSLLYKLNMESHKLTIRYCDLGVPQICKKMGKLFNFHFMPASGYELEENLICIVDHSDIRGATLTNEITYKSMSNYSPFLIQMLEVQVHGHILLQHSGRHLLKGKGGEVVKMWARSETHQGKIFPCVDNRHGHFMYFWAQRCLISFLSQLYDLSLKSWLIDVRGEPLDYKKVVWEMYADTLKELKEGKSIKDTMLEQRKNRIKEVSRYPLHKGFFGANNTSMAQKVHHIRRAIKGFGKVVSLLSRWLVVKLENPLNVGEMIVIITTEGQRKELEIKKMRALDNSFITMSHKREYVLIPRCKGVSVGATLVEKIGKDGKKE